MGKQNRKLKAVDMVNGFTYIGISDDNFPCKLEDYVVVPTIRLFDGDGYCERDVNHLEYHLRNQYDGGAKCPSTVRLQERVDERNRVAVHDLGEIADDR